MTMLLLGALESEPARQAARLSVFQVLALVFLAAMLAIDVVRWFWGRGPRWLRLVRPMLWLAAAVAIARPDLTTRFANLIGIGRGADVVLYVFVLAFLVTSFYWYSRHVLIQRQLTEIVRHLAILQAKRGPQTETKA
jgi:hypothetical protein